MPCQNGSQISSSEVDRVINNNDLGQRSQRHVAGNWENLTDPKSEEIIDLMEHKPWRSRSECERARAVIAAELKNLTIEIEEGHNGWRIRIFWSACRHALWKWFQAKGFDYDES